MDWIAKFQAPWQRRRERIAIMEAEQDAYFRSIPVPPLTIADSRLRERPAGSAAGLNERGILTRRGWGVVCRAGSARDQSRRTGLDAPPRHTDASEPWQTARPRPKSASTNRPEAIRDLAVSGALPRPAQRRGGLGSLPACRSIVRQPALPWGPNTCQARK
jgi:hypothetical protein